DRLTRAVALERHPRSERDAPRIGPRRDEDRVAGGRERHGARDRGHVVGDVPARRLDARAEQQRAEQQRAEGAQAHAPGAHHGSHTNRPRARTPPAGSTTWTNTTPGATVPPVLSRPSHVRRAVPSPAASKDAMRLPATV